MDECNKHYTTMFNPLIQSSNRTFYSPTSFTVPASEPLLSIQKVPSINAVPLLSSLDETTLLDSGLLDQISPDKIKFQPSRMSTTSSSGTDGITVIMLRYLQDTSFTEHIYQLYTPCLTKEKHHNDGIKPACSLHTRRRRNNTRRATHVQLPFFVSVAKYSNP